MSDSDNWYVAKTQDDGVIARLQSKNRELGAQLAEASEAIDKLLTATRLCYSDDKDAEKNIQHAMKVLDRTPAESLRVREAELAVIEAMRDYVKDNPQFPEAIFIRKLADLDAAKGGG